MAWPPTDAPTGGKDNLTRQLNDHPNEHNVIAAWCSDAFGQIEANKQDVANKAPQHELDALDSLVKVPTQLAGGWDMTGFGTWAVHLIGGVVQVAVGRKGDSDSNIGTVPAEYAPNVDGGHVYATGVALDNTNQILPDPFVVRINSSNGRIRAQWAPATADWCYCVVQYIPGLVYPSNTVVPPP